MSTPRDTPALPAGGQEGLRLLRIFYRNSQDVLYQSVLHLRSVNVVILRFLI